MTSTTKFAVALAVLCFIQVAMPANVRRSAEEDESLEELINFAKDQLRNITEEVNKVVKSYNFEEVRSAMEKRTSELDERAKNVMEVLKQQYETYGPGISERASAAYNDAIERLNGSLQYLKTKGPEALDEVSGFQQRFRDTFMSMAETIFEETGKLAKAAGADAENVHKDFTEVSRTALRYTMDGIQNLHSDIENYLNTSTKS